MHKPAPPPFSSKMHLIEPRQTAQPTGVPSSFTQAIILFLCIVTMAPASKAEGQCRVPIPAVLNPKSEQATMLKSLVELERQQHALQRELGKQLAAATPSDERDRLQEQLSKTGLTLYNDENGKKITRICPFDNKKSARYILEVVNRIEDCGTHFFPKENGKKLYGVGSISFTLDRDGKVIDKHVTESSGNAKLDGFFLKMVMLSAPFGQVPAEFHDDQFDQFIYSSSFETKKSNEALGKPKKRCMQVNN
jgi:protein TonB